MSAALSVGDLILLKPLKDVRSKRTVDVLGLNETMEKRFGKWHIVTDVYIRDYFTVFEIDDGYMYAEDWIEQRTAKADLQNEVII